MSLKSVPHDAACITKARFLLDHRDLWKTVGNATYFNSKSVLGSKMTTDRVSNERVERWEEARENGLCHGQSGIRNPSQTSVDLKVSTHAAIKNVVHSIIVVLPDA